MVFCFLDMPAKSIAAFKARNEARMRRKARAALQAIWDANGAAIWAVNQNFKKKYGREMDAATREQAIKEATVNGRFDAEAYADNLAKAAAPPPADAPFLNRVFHRNRLSAAREAEKKRWLAQARDERLPSSYPVADMSWKKDDYAQLDHAREVAEESKEESWWQRGLHWIDSHQPQTALAVGIGVGLAAAAIVLTGGLAAPVAIGLAIGAAGLTVGAGTVGLNTHFHRPLTTDMRRNVGYAAGAAAVTSGLVIGAGLLVQSGVVQQGIYRVGNAATHLCLTRPAACARVGAAFELWDKLEDVGLRAQLAIQTARGDPRAAETALQLQLEQMDGVPGNTTFREIQEALQDLVGRHGDDVVGLVGRFGMEGAELLAEHQDDAIRYLDNVADIDLANLNLEQGYVVSELAQELDIPITITGRWADTPAEAALRKQAAEDLQTLIEQGIDLDLAKVQIGRKYGIDPHQVKISSGDPEIDIFIPKEAWDALLPEQQDLIRQRLGIFNPDNDSRFKVDFYQNLPLEKVELGWPDPRINVPPGSIIFNPDGTVIHEPFAVP